MAATGTTASELLIDIDNIIGSKTQPNSITPSTHSDLLNNIVKVLSGTTGGGDYLPLSGGTLNGLLRLTELYTGTTVGSRNILVNTVGDITVSKEYIATLSTNASFPSLGYVSVKRDTLGYSGTWSRTGVGVYQYDITTMPNIGDAGMHFTATADGASSVRTITVQTDGINNNQIVFKCYDSSGSATDNCLFHIKMELFL